MLRQIFCFSKNKQCSSVKLAKLVYSNEAKASFDGNDDWIVDILAYLCLFSQLLSFCMFAGSLGKLDQNTIHDITEQDPFKLS